MLKVCLGKPIGKKGKELTYVFGCEDCERVVSSFGTKKEAYQTANDLINAGWKHVTAKGRTYYVCSCCKMTEKALRAFAEKVESKDSDEE